jgi:hypothetical protein
MRQPELWAIPVKVQLFPAKPSDIEERKTDYLKTIVSVRSVAGAMGERDDEWLSRGV